MVNLGSAKALVWRGKGLVSPASLAGGGIRHTRGAPVGFAGNGVREKGKRLVVVRGDTEYIPGFDSLVGIRPGGTVQAATPVKKYQVHTRFSGTHGRAARLWVACFFM